MMARHWDLVYGRPPISLDAVLFGVAVAIHLPLFLLHFKAPLPPSQSAESKSDFDNRVAFVDEIMNRPVVPPPSIPDFIVRPPISKLVPAHTLPPIAIPPINVTPGLSRESLGTPGITPPKINGISPNPIAGPIGNGPLAGGAPSIAGIPTGDKIALPGLGGDGTAGRTANLSSRISPLAPNEVEGIGGGAISAGHTPVVSIPEPARPTLALALLPAGHAHPEKISPGRANFLEAKPHSNQGILKGPGVGVVAPIVPRLGKGEPDFPQPVLEAHSFPSTAAGRKMENFPIYGELKDRVVKYQELPEVPDAFKKKGEQNVVQFRFWVTRDGRVKENIELLKGSGSAGLDEIARTALLHWVFSALPPEKGNLVQSGTIEFKFSFK